MKIINQDPTLRQTAAIIALIWFITLCTAAYFLMQPNKPNTLLTPIVYDVNGVMMGSGYVWGQIR